MLNLSLYIFCFTVIPQSFFPPEAYIIALIFINFKRANITQKLVPAYAGQDTIHQRTRLQRRGDVGMPVARKVSKETRN